MREVYQINKNTNIPVLEWKGRRVVTYVTIATAHGISYERVKKAFQRHRTELVKEEDYFDLNHDEAIEYLNAFVGDNVSHAIAKVQGLRLFTESGYLMLASTFTGGKTAIVRRMLINSYFSHRQENTAMAQAYENICAANQKIIDGIERTYETITASMEKSNQMLDKISEAVNAITNSLSGSNTPEEEQKFSSLEEFEQKPDEMTLEQIAKAMNWYSERSSLPHTQFAREVARACGIKTYTTQQHNDALSRCVILEGDTTMRKLYIKMPGIERMDRWCAEHDNGRSCMVEVKSEKDTWKRKKGDIIDRFYQVEIPGSRIPPKKYRLKDIKD